MIRILRQDAVQFKPRNNQQKEAISILLENNGQVSSGKLVAPVPLFDNGTKKYLEKYKFNFAIYDNKFIQAAMPIIVLLGLIRTSSKIESAKLMARVSTIIEEMERYLKLQNVDSFYLNEVKYILCATVDDIVQNIPGKDREFWAQNSMLSNFCGERVGGVRFFEKLNQARANPLH